MKEYKFLPLEKYLENSNDELIELTFDDIEKILGQALSDSAYKYRAYCSLSKTHTFPNSWLNAGYRIGELDLQEQRVLYRKRGAKVEVNKENKEIKKSEVKNYLLNIDFAILKIDKYMAEINRDENARYLSWEYCYKQFGLLKDKEVTKQEVDFLSLHLAFYLASWGMYRGLSFLLQKDYKVHKDTILELFKEEYKALWDISCEELLKEDNLNLIFKLSIKLEEIYIEKRKNIDRRKDISEILITKILMGTLGCVPAYDRYFKAGVRKYGVTSGTYNQNSIYDLARFYEEHKEKLESYRLNIPKDNIEYPQMKILDMCFWQIGYDLENVWKGFLLIVFTIIACNFAAKRRNFQTIHRI